MRLVGHGWAGQIVLLVTHLRRVVWVLVRVLVRVLAHAAAVGGYKLWRSIGIIAQRNSEHGLDSVASVLLRLLLVLCLL